jgi:hypothetical protein
VRETRDDVTLLRKRLCQLQIHASLTIGPDEAIANYADMHIFAP